MNYITCTNCGEQLPSDARFCENCGTGVKTEPICSYCGCHLAEYTEFCPDCGNKTNMVFEVLDLGRKKLRRLELSGVVIKSLICWGNELEMLDLSKVKGLIELCCDGNMPSLDLSKNIELESLEIGDFIKSLTFYKNRGYCHDLQLSVLDLSNNIALEVLNCSYMPIKHLNLSHNINLVNIDCRYCSLETLDLTHNTKLCELKCDNNHLEALDLSHNLELQILMCSGNLLKTLDLSHNTKLWELSCDSNHLEALDLSQLHHLSYLACRHNSLIIVENDKHELTGASSLRLPPHTFFHPSTYGDNINMNRYIVLMKSKLSDNVQNILNEDQSKYIGIILTKLSDYKRQMQELDIEISLEKEGWWMYDVQQLRKRQILLKNQISDLEHRRMLVSRHDKEIIDELLKIRTNESARIDDLIANNGKYMLLGNYHYDGDKKKGIVTLYVNNIELSASRLESEFPRETLKYLTGYVFIHEMFHAYYNSIGVENINEVEEAMTEYATLDFIADVFYDNLTLAINQVETKRYNPFWLSSYGFGKYLYDQSRNYRRFGYADLIEKYKEKKLTIASSNVIAQEYRKCFENGYPWMNEEYCYCLLRALLSKESIYEIE